MEPPDPSFADEFNVPQEDAVLVFDVRRDAVSFPFQVHRLKVLVEAGLVAFSSACFEFADEVPKEAQHGSLAHLPKVFFQPSSRPFEGYCCRVLRVRASSPPLSVDMLRSSQLPHTGPRAPTLCSAWALRALYQFGRSGKHYVGHVGGDVTDAGAIGNWW